MNAKSFIPPVLFQLLRRLRNGGVMKRYKSYDDALIDSHSYEDPDIIQVVSSKTMRLKDAMLACEDKNISNRQTAQNLFVLSHVANDQAIDVLEIGGACGASYFELNHLLPGCIKNWNILETPAMTATGKSFASEGRLKFFDSLQSVISNISKVDLIFAQGVMQYLPNPLKALEDLLNLGAEWVYISRTVVGKNIEMPVITKQTVKLSSHGPGLPPKEFVDRITSQPLTIVPMQSIESCISVGYRIIYFFLEGSSIMRIQSQKLKTEHVGFLLHRNKPTNGAT